MKTPYGKWLIVPLTVLAFVALFFYSPTDLGLSVLYADHADVFGALDRAFFTASLLGSLAIISCSLGDTKRFFSRISVKAWAFLAVLTILALFLRLYLPMRTIRWTVLDLFFFDSPVLRGTGWSYLVKYATMLFEPTYATAMHLTAILGTLTVIAAFALSYLLFKEETPAILAAFLFAISPAMIIVSKDGEYTTPAIFFSLLVFSALLLYARLGKPRFLVLSALLLAVTVRIRPEYFFLLFIYFFAAPLFLKRKDLWRAAGVFALSIFVALPYLIPFLANLKDSTNDVYLHGTPITERNSLEPYVLNAIRLLRENAQDNIWVFFNNTKVTIPETLLAILGAWSLSRSKDRRALYFLLLYGGVFFSLVSLLHQEGFSNSWFKYLPSILAPLLILAGVGFARIAGFGGSLRILLVLSLLAYASYEAYSRNYHDAENDRYEAAKYLEYERLRAYSHSIDRSCYAVYSGQDSLIHNTLAIKSAEIRDTGGLAYFLAHPPREKCLYIFGGYYDPEKDRTEEWTRIDQAYMLRSFNRTYSLERVFDEQLPERYRPAGGRNFLYAATLQEQ